ncbi:MAG: SpoIIE family protein phosphatase [Eubacteriales bacterium]|nr:SpoIIE family protein phosphatase [Eubacteriales bacterium]
MGRKFSIDTYSMSMNKKGEELCGDMVNVIYTPSKSVVVLADGMGSGVKANILATLTSKIIATMLAGGASIIDCVDTITDTLPVCSERGIAYSTFTIIEVGSEGGVYTAEFDGPELIIIRDGVIDENMDKHMRVINGKNIWECYFRAQPDDMIVTFSDGVIHAGIGQLLNLGWRRENVVEFVQRNYRKKMPARDMTRTLMGICDDLYEGEPGDDTTVTTVRIVPQTETRVLVGPPASRDDDRRVVDILMSASGKKIVCGGSTSQLVARELGRPLRGDTKYYSEDVPPIAYIDGVDLVTEGVLTLTAAETLMEKYLHEVETGQKPGKYVDLEKEDGATKLVKLLADSTTDITFMLGQANNPAYNKSDPRLGLDVKMRIVTSIAEKLEKLGRKIKLEEY